MEARKRGRVDGVFNGNGGVKRNKHETENFTTGIGSKSKPCTKFFSTAGCPFGEGCHFLHYVPGGYSAVTQMTNIGNSHSHPPASRNPMSAPSVPNGSSAAVKTKMCNKMNTPEGCKFGEKCHFAHSESELGKSAGPPHKDPRGMGPPMMPGRFPGRHEPAPQDPAAASFGASATAKISVHASLAGAIIGKGGVNSKHICGVTGVRLSIKDNESDATQKNIELEGTFDQIKEASSMVRELIINISSNSNMGPPPMHSGPAHHAPHHAPAANNFKPAANNFKTKLCENFNKGACTFGDRCHFAHGANELRKGAGA